MATTVRIGNAHGFWGDRLEAAREMLAAEPELDFVTFDFLAEVSMSILAAQQVREPGVGYARDFVEIVRSLVPYWRSGGRCRLISNAGGLTPAACAHACREVLAEAGLELAIAVVSGDDVLDLIRGEAAADPAAPGLRHMDTGEPIGTILDRLVTANAYLGAEPIAEALDLGADLVITGRVADPSLTVGVCLHHFRWDPDDHDRVAGATVAGHLIECGTQATGGILTDWLDVPELARIGFPIVEVSGDGSFVLTKPHGSGGCVTEGTVKEQLLYEVGNPAVYLSPDVTVSFLSLEVQGEGADRVRVSGARGSPPPDRLKVSATFRDGFQATGQLTVFGEDAVLRARRAGTAVLKRLNEEGITFREELVECVGAGSCLLGGEDERGSLLTETVLRVAVSDPCKAAVERFRKAFPALITAGPQGTTGYADGRPRVRPVIRFWPCLVDRGSVTPQVGLLEAADVIGQSAGGADNQGQSEVPISPVTVSGPGRTMRDAGMGQTPPKRTTGSEAGGGFSARARERHGQRLSKLAYARSGDKGLHANIGLIARRTEDFERLRQEVTAERVAAHFGMDDASDVLRYELPNLGALNFVLRGVLRSPLRTDAQGKALGQILLEMPLDPSGTM